MDIGSATLETRLTEAHIQAAVGPQAMAAARPYLHGRVKDIVLHDGGAHIKASTQGTEARPYRQRISLRQAPSGFVTVSGACSCPVGHNCKHVAAVLLSLLDGESNVSHPVPAGLPVALANWVGEIARAEKREASEPAAQPTHYLIYVLSSHEQIGNKVLEFLVEPTVARVNKQGELVVQRKFHLHEARNPTPPRYVSPADQVILDQLNYSRTGPLATPATEELLGKILGTGRVRWGSVKGPVLSLGDERPGRIRWRMNEDGSQDAIAEADTPALTMLVHGPFYIDAEAGVAGPLNVGIPRAAAAHLLRGPAIPLADAPAFRNEFIRQLPNVPAPPPVPEPKLIKEAMIPCVRFFTSRISVYTGYSHHFSPAPGAELRFQYGPVEIDEGDWRDVLARDGTPFRIARNRKAENKARNTLIQAGFAPAGPIAEPPQRRSFVAYSAESIIPFMVTMVPALRREGWRIEVEPDFPVKVAEPDDAVSVELIDGSGIDWLELQMGVHVGGERIDLAPVLVSLIGASHKRGIDLAADMEALSEDASCITKLPDGRLLPLPVTHVRPILLALLELFERGAIDPAEPTVRFTRFDAADVATLEETSGLVWKGGEALRTLGRILREAGGAIPEAPIPAEFHGTLRPYQARGVDWLQFLRSAGLGGVLADDMGLGKTVQTLAHLAIEKAEARLDKPALIVCPTSVLWNWVREVERFAPHLKVVPLHGAARKALFGEIPSADLVLTTYPLLSRDASELLQHEWHAVVLDEAQMIKNPNAETTRLAGKLKARQRICLSGTPLQNHLGELWSLFDFLAPGFLGTARSFRSRYRTPIEKRGDEQRRAHLIRRVLPFLLRRTKEEVAFDLPAKTEIAEQVEMEAAQRAVYESVRLAMHDKVRQAIAARGLARSGIVILDALLKMRQACCDPRLLKLRAVAKTTPRSAKLERLMEMLPMMLEEGRRVLLFSQFTTMLALIEQRLRADSISYVLLTGNTKDRAAPIARFQKGEVPLFLISLKAGGVGLNLTAADTVIHYDPWWNPAVEDQATDRAHRIGQDKNVFVHRLVTLGTIEEKMEVLKEKKRALVASVLEAGNGGALALTEDDVESLFGE